jgi:hypothetical protein
MVFFHIISYETRDRNIFLLYKEKKVVDLPTTIFTHNFLKFIFFFIFQLKIKINIQSKYVPTWHPTLVNKN